LGVEWISVPDDRDVEFSVSSEDVQAFIEHMEMDEEGSNDQQAVDEIHTKYWTSSIQYGVNPQIIEKNRVFTVSDTITRIKQNTIDPGVENRIEIKNDRSDFDIIDIHPDSEPENEYIIFENTGEDPLAISGWTVKSPGGRTYTFPEGFQLDPDEPVTIHTGDGQDTGTNKYWGEEESVWDYEEAEVIVTNADGTTMLHVWYDAQRVIYYDEPPRGQDDDSGGLTLGPVDIPDWAPAAGAAGLILGAAAYLKRLSKRQNKHRGMYDVDSRGDEAKDDLDDRESESIRGLDNRCTECKTPLPDKTQPCHTCGAVKDE
jgi:hypothetical protein